MFLTTISAFGFFSWIGLTFTPPVGAAPSMITIIAVADCMHFLVSYYHELSVGKSKASAIRNALRTNIRPMFLTTLATVIGLLCLNFSEAPPYRDLGNIVAFGAIVAFVLSAIFLPAVLHCLPAPKRKSVANTGVTLFTKLEGLSHWVIKYYKFLISVILILTLIGVSQVFRNDLGDSWVDNYDDSFEIRKTLDIQNQWMYGSQYIDYRVGGKHPQSLNNPGFMGDVERIADWLRNNPDVRYVSSFSDNVKTINKALHADKQEYYSIPEDPNLLAQTNLLYELTLPFGMGPDEQVNFDQSATRLTISLQDMSSRELLDFDETFTGWAEANLSYASVSSGTGIQKVYAHIMQSNIVELTKGTILAFALISLSLIWLLKSVKLGLISIVPNIFPLILAYGAWGILDGRVDLSVSVVGTMSLGLVVDDTIHFLSKYQWARTQKGEDVYQAIRYAFRTAGVAMVITTLILALGFALLLFSHFRPTWAMGGMLSMTVVFALLVDLLLLPGLLIVFDKKSAQDNKAVRGQCHQLEPQ
jgi:predicted RND superfamily exporter protein